MNKIKNIITTVAFAAVLFSVSLACVLKPETEYSESERRALEKMPELSVQTVINGEFMKNFESYATDQFPMREELRTVKAGFVFGALNKLENNGLFVADGHISKVEPAADEKMMDYAAERFAFIKDEFLADNTNIYLTIIPDKNFILAKENAYPHIDYNSFAESMKKRLPYMKYIDITQMLSLDDYYTTDTHWKQEKIVDIAHYLAKEMGADASAEYTVNTLENPFNGVYSGQLAMPFAPDTIHYLTNDTINNAIVKYYSTGAAKQGDMYNMKKAFGKDPYEMFLSGSEPIVTIENPNAKTEKELVVFRDSFGASIAPLMAEGYKKITLVDIRYIQSGVLGNFVEFENADVLFMYSVSLLNNSTALR